MTPETRERLKAASVVERNKAICDARREGASLREIAVVVGLTHAGVAKIIRSNVQLVLRDGQTVMVHVGQSISFIGEGGAGGSGKKTTNQNKENPK